MRGGACCRPCVVWWRGGGCCVAWRGVNGRRRLRVSRDAVFACTQHNVCVFVITCRRRIACARLPWAVPCGATGRGCGGVLARPHAAPTVALPAGHVPTAHPSRHACLFCVHSTATNTRALHTRAHVAAGAALLPGCPLARCLVPAMCVGAHPPHCTAPYRTTPHHTTTPSTPTPRHHRTTHTTLHHTHTHAYTTPTPHTNRASTSRTSAGWAGRSCPPWAAPTGRRRTSS